MAWKAGRDDAVDLPRSMIASPDLDLDVSGRDEPWLMILICWRQGDSKLARGFSMHGQRCKVGKIERIRQTVEDAVSFANVGPLAPVRLDTYASAEKYDRYLVVAGRKCPGALRVKAAQVKIDVVPAGQCWRHLNNYSGVCRVTRMYNQVTLVILAHTLPPVKLTRSAINS